MKINNEVLEGLLASSGKSQFDDVSRVVLREVFGIDPVNVDRSGDGGGDFVVIPKEGGPRIFLSQVTIKDDGWEKKAVADARKAQNKLDCSRYFYLTNRKHHSVKFRKIEAEIIRDLGIPATCIGAVEIADFAISQGFVEAILDALGAPHLVQNSSRPDRQQMLLHSFVAIGSETNNLRDQVYEDAILLVLYDDDGLDADKLIGKAIEFLSCDVSREGRIRGRLDSLLSKGILIKDKDKKKFLLSEPTRALLSTAERVYEQQLSSSASTQALLIESGYGIDWPIDSAAKASVIIAKLFIEKQLSIVEKGGAVPNRIPILRDLGDPLGELSAFLLQKGIEGKKVNNAVEALLHSSESDPLIAKLVRGALFAALEGQSSLQACQALGVKSWSDISVYVDASVLIPYLAAKITKPSSGRFSAGSIAAIDALKEAGAKLLTTQFYLSEAANHLIKATRYCDAPIPQELLTKSANGYVSHYYKMLEQGIEVPSRLVDFLKIISPSVVSGISSTEQAIKVGSEIQAILNDYGIDYDHVGKVDRIYSQPIEERYAVILLDRGIERRDVLVEHDVRLLAHLRKSRITEKKALICLTWDRLMMSVAEEVGECGWVMTPYSAADFVRAEGPLSNVQLISVSHRLAAVRSEPDEIIGNVLDRIVGYSQKHDLDWKLIDKLKELRARFYERIEHNADNFREWALHEADSLMKEVGIAAQDKDDVDEIMGKIREEKHS